MRKILAAMCMLVFLSLPLCAQTIQASAFLLDVSKSIPSEDFQTAKDTISHLVQTQSPVQEQSIYLFGSRVHKIAIDELPAVRRIESYTTIYDAAYEAAKDLSSKQARSKQIVIFSDGYDTNSVLTLEDLVAFAKKEDIRIHTVGLGHPNRRTLERIAKLTGGSFTIGSSQTLVKSLETQLADSEQNLEAVPPPIKPDSVAIPKSPSDPPAIQKPAVTKTAQDKEGAGFISPGKVAALLIVVVLVGGYLFVQGSKTKRKEEATEKAVAGETPADTTQDLGEALQGFQLESGNAWPERSQQTQEILSRTYVLTETPVLYVKKGPHRGKSFALQNDQPVSIGRSRVNEIRLDDEAVSAQHCRIIPEDGHYVLYDLESTNGTFVGDSKITRTALNPGDTIKVGDTYFTYKLQQRRQ